MAESTHLQDKPNLRFVTLVSLVAAVGGILFGYDTAVISGAIGFMAARFNLGPAMQGWTVSSLIVGAIIGCAFAGVLSDRYGRKKILLLAALLFAIGSIGSALPNMISVFVILRMIGGVGVGIASILSPLYIAEIAPANIRGRLVSLNQLAVVTGIFVVYWINLGITNAGNPTWDINYAWRWMLGIGLVPGAVFFILLLIVPESPRWLEKNGFEEKALSILKKVSGEKMARESLQEIKHSLEEEKTGSMGQLFKPGLRWALAVGILLAIFQQVVGINAIMYYAPEIFKNSGAGQNASMVETVLTGFINFAFTFVAIWLIDKVGRKALLLWGTALMAISLLVVGLAFRTGNTSGPLLLIFICIYVAAFAVSMGPVVWVILAEIFPNNIRGRASSIASMALWAADYLVSQLFPIMLNGVGPAVTFFIFVIFTVLAFLFTAKWVPETKGKSLEEIEKVWLSRS